MKSMLIPIRPEWAAKILNGDKTIEIRKTAPKEWVDYLSGKTKEKPKPMTGYIYCTKGKNRLVWNTINNIIAFDNNHYAYGDIDLNGKVVAKFTLKEVYEARPFFHWCDGCVKATGLTRDEVLDYLDSKDKSVSNAKRQGRLYAYHISDLVIFNKPMEITEFKRWKEYPSCKKCPHAEDEHDIAVCENRCKELLTVKRAPQSWMYVEVSK